MCAMKLIQDVGQVESALHEARAYAEEHGVPLTLERVAVCLGISRGRLIEYAERYEPVNEDEEAVQRAIKGVYAECNASMMEHGLVKGNSPIMPIFALKANYGYNDRPENDAVSVNVTITGEHDLKD